MPIVLKRLGAFLTALVVLTASAMACEGRVVAAGVHAAPVCIPSSPQRIVTLDPLLTLGMLIDLDVPVTGTAFAGIGEASVRQKALEAGIADVGHPLQPSLEAIAVLKPDLIVGASYAHGELYDTLSRIAPTLLIDHMAWKDHFRMVATLADKASEADAMLADYEERVAAIRQNVPPHTVSVVRLRPGGFNVFLDGPQAYAPYAVLREAGIERTAYETTDTDTIEKRPGWEDIGALEGDILIFVADGGDTPAQDDALAAEVMANPLWQALPAVRAGRAYRAEKGTWMGFQGISSANRVLDDIQTYIIGRP